MTICNSHENRRTKELSAHSFEVLETLINQFNQCLTMLEFFLHASPHYFVQTINLGAKGSNFILISLAGKALFLQADKISYMAAQTYYGGVNGIRIASWIIAVLTSILKWGWRGVGSKCVMPFGRLALMSYIIHHKRNRITVPNCS